MTKKRSPFTYERVRFYNQVHGKHQYIILAKIGDRIVKHYIER